MEELNALDPFTQDLIHRLDPKVLNSLTPAQLSGIIRAIQSSNRGNRLVDIRTALPFFFARYYCVFLVCRDRTAFRQQTELFRRKRYSFMGGVVFGSLVLLPIFFMIFIFLYLIKYVFGLDFIPNFHLYDIFGW